MSFFKQHKRTASPDTDEEDDDNVDPELRLRTVRTAASALAVSVKSEQRAERRKSRQKGFFRRRAAAKRPAQPAPSAATPTSRVHGARRNIYVNHPLSAMEVDHTGEPKVRYV